MRVVGRRTGSLYLRGCARGLLGGAAEITEASNRICCASYSGLHKKPPVLHIATARRQGHCGREDLSKDTTCEYASRCGVVKVGIWETMAKHLVVVYEDSVIELPK